MKLPIIRGVIDRRILVSYRVEPSVVAAMLPHPFRPQIVHGVAIAGICLIRLEDIRPRFLPQGFGVASENVAHRVAVEWNEDGIVCQGVYIWRRDTNSWINALVGGRIFPGVHHRAAFVVRELSDQFRLVSESEDGATCLCLSGHRANTLPATSVFRTLEEAASFYRGGSCGYSPARDPARYQGVELRCDHWNLEPLALTAVRSNFFDDRSRFPVGSIELDSALLMCGVPHEWHAAPDIVGAQAASHWGCLTRSAC